MITSQKLIAPLIALALIALHTSRAAAGPETTDAAAGDSSGWTDLLSPETEKLGEHWRTSGNWALENGVATLTPRPGEEGWSRFEAYLWSKKKYGDFLIEFDYKLQEHGNSGFYFRVGDRNDPVQQGIEVQLYESASKPKDAKLTDHDAGGIIPGVPPKKRNSKPAGQWNTMRVKNVGGRLVVTLNGVVVNRVDLSQKPFAERPREGWIGFQDHAMPISLRNVRIREVK